MRRGIMRQQLMHFDPAGILILSVGNCFMFTSLFFFFYKTFEYHSERRKKLECVSKLCPVIG